MFFYFHGSVHRNPILRRSNKMKQYAGIYLLQNHSLHVSGVHRTHHQENIKLTPTSDTGHSNRIATTFLQRGQYVGGRLLLFCYYDLYQRLELQFYVLLMMGAMDTRNT